jgi:hypothetical protein
MKFNITILLGRKNNYKLYFMVYIFIIYLQNHFFIHLKMVIIFLVLFILFYIQHDINVQINIFKK